MVKLQEAENQIIIAYRGYDQRPIDSELLPAAIETHQATLGCTPGLVPADAGFHSAKNELPVPDTCSGQFGPISSLNCPVPATRRLGLEIFRSNARVLGMGAVDRRKLAAC
jgi:hypothetical protein